jgi:hypothetical protein
MKLRQTLVKPVQGYWDGGAKQVFEWEVESHAGGRDKKGEFVRVGSYEANHYFHVAKGKTTKQTLGYAKQHLKASTRYPSKFEYVEGTWRKKKPIKRRK